MHFTTLCYDLRKVSEDVSDDKVSLLHKYQDFVKLKRKAQII